MQMDVAKFLLTKEDTLDETPTKKVRDKIISLSDSEQMYTEIAQGMTLKPMDGQGRVFVCVWFFFLQ